MTYVIVWEFHVPLEKCGEFERAYGPDGDWAGLFQRSARYEGTELLRSTLDDQAVSDEFAPESSADAEQNGRTYWTIDRWASRDAYLAFSEQYAAAYQEYDDRFLALTNTETCLGKFEVVE